MRKTIFPHLKVYVHSVYMRYPSAPKMDFSELRAKTWDIMPSEDKWLAFNKSGGDVHDKLLISYNSLYKSRKMVEKEIKEAKENKAFCEKENNWYDEDIREELKLKAKLYDEIPGYIKPLLRKI